MKRIILIIIIPFFFATVLICQIKWEHISSKTGAIEVPNQGRQQTSAAVADFEKDGINDFCISERTSAPGLVWYRRTVSVWKRYIVEDAICFIEAGTVPFNVDNDGDAPRIDIWLQNGTGENISDKK